MREFIGWGGFDQCAGSLRWPEWVGTTTVPGGPTVSIRAMTTA
jgi:hypothetical protein